MSLPDNPIVHQTNIPPENFYGEDSDIYIKISLKRALAIIVFFLSTSVGTFLYLERKIDSVNSTLDSKLAKLDDVLDRKIDGKSRYLDERLEREVNQLSLRVDGVFNSYSPAANGGDSVENK